MTRLFLAVLLLMTALALVPSEAAAQPKKKAEFEAWVKQTRDLPAEQRAQAVIVKLVEHNPGFTAPRADVKLSMGKVTELSLANEYIVDIEPIRALPDLRKFTCAGGIAGIEGLDSCGHLQQPG